MNRRDLYKMKVIKRPSELRAYQWKKKMRDTALGVFEGDGYRKGVPGKFYCYSVEGNHPIKELKEDDWIIEESSGGYLTCSPERFNILYQRIGE